MALEAVVFPQDHPFGYATKDLYNMLGGNYGYDFGLSRDQEEEKISFDSLQSQHEDLLSGQWDSSLDIKQMHEFHQTNCSSHEAKIGANFSSGFEYSSLSMHKCNTRRKKRRQRTTKNKEDIENQRMTHIAVERNRRKQMNEYLAVLRSLMPEFYVQRGDQASIVGGAINFVKELEQHLHIIATQKEMHGKSEGNSYLPFSDFFAFPQYSTYSSHHCKASFETMAKNKSDIADIEVTIVESHANLKIRSRRRPKQLLRMVSWLHSMCLTVLHLNVTRLDQILLYSICVKTSRFEGLACTCY